MVGSWRRMSFYLFGSTVFIIALAGCASKQENASKVSAAEPSPSVMSALELTEKYSLEDVQAAGLILTHLAGLQKAATEQNAEQVAVHASWVEAMARETQLRNLPNELWQKHQQGLVDLQKARIDNAGRVIANEGQVVGNLNGMAQVENARIRNFGEAIQNEGHRLDNISKILDLQLKQMYMSAYSNYVDAYARYVEAMIEISRQKEVLRNDLMSAQLDVKMYRRKTNVCFARSEQLMRHKFAEANQELSDSQLTVSKIRSLFTNFSAEVKGVECTERILLEYANHDRKYLRNIIFEAERIGTQKVQGNCGTLDQTPMAFNDAASFQTPLAGQRYPFVEYNEAFTPTAFYHPVTYFQLYGLLMDNSVRVDIAPPSNSDKEICPYANPKVANYVDASRYLEQSMAYDLGREENLDLGQPAFGTIALSSASSTQNGNRSYQSLMADLKTIFERIKGCTDHAKNNPLTTAPLFANPVTPDAVPASFMAIFDDPKFPKQSEAIRVCMHVAEDYRHRAFATDVAIGKILQTFQEHAQEDVPRAPAPVFDRFIPAPGLNPGT